MFGSNSVIRYALGASLLLRITYSGLFKIYHMTPSWAETHASFINCQHTTTVDQITFNSGSVMGAALLKIPLIAPGVLQDSMRITTEITAVHDVTKRNAFDSDVRYGISDGSRFIGFEVCDKGNYLDHSPCYGVEGIPGASYLSSIRHIEYKSPGTNDSRYPGQIVFTLKLDERRGFCQTAHDGGFTKATGYSHRLMFSKGLSLEVYKEDSGAERVGIKYIKVVVMETP